MTTSRQPIQPVLVDSNNSLRFKENAIVTYLLDNGGIDLNHLAIQDFSNEDREQFAQLIGYSLSGFAELNYVSNETYAAAQKMAEGMTEEQARISYLEGIVSLFRSALRPVVSEIFQISEEDLID